MSDRILAPYSSSHTIQFSIYNSSGSALITDAVYTTGSVTTTLDGGTEVNVSGGFVDIGTGYKMVLEPSELAGKSISLYFISSSYWLDKVINIETYGNANAQHPNIGTTPLAASDILADGVKVSGSLLDVAVSSRSTLTQAEVVVDATPISSSLLDVAVSSRSTLTVDDILADGIKISGSLINNTVPVHGQVRSGTSNSIGLPTSAPSTDTILAGAIAYVSGGAAHGQTRLLVSYTGSTNSASVDPDWDVIPTTNSFVFVFPIPPAAELFVPAVDVRAWSGSIVTGGAIPNAVAGATGGLAISSDAIAISGGASSTPLSASQARDIVDAALVAIDLDHLAFTSKGIETIVSGSYLDQLLSSGSTSTYDRTTDSLEAIRNRGDVFWTGSAGTLTAADILADGVKISGSLIDAAISSRGTSTFNSSSDAVVVVTNQDKSGYSISGTKQTLDALADLTAADILADGTRVSGSLLDVAVSSRGTSTFNSSSDAVVVVTNQDKTGYFISGTKTTLDVLNDLEAADIVVGGTAISGSLLDAAISSRSTFDSGSGVVVVVSNQDKTGYFISGTKTTLDVLADVSASEVRQLADDALFDINLHYWMSASLGIENVVSGSFLDQILDDGSAVYNRTTDSLQALRDRGDIAWTGTGTGSAVTEILNVTPLIPESIDLANTASWRLGLMLINSRGDLPTTAEITPGTVAIDRKAVGDSSWTSVLGDTAASEANGMVYIDEVFDTGTGYAEGDSIRITFKSQQITVDAVNYEITDTTGRIFYTEIRQTMRGTDNASTLTAADILADGVKISGSLLDAAVSAATGSGGALSADDILADGVKISGSLINTNLDAAMSSRSTLVASDVVVDGTPISSSLLDSAISSIPTSSFSADDILADGVKISGSLLDAAVSSRSTLTQAEVVVDGTPISSSLLDSAISSIPTSSFSAADILADGVKISGSLLDRHISSGSVFDSASGYVNVGTINSGSIADMADGFLRRNIQGGSDSGRNLSEAYYRIRNRVTRNAVYLNDDTTPAYTLTSVTGSTSGGPVIEVNPS